MDYWVGGEGFDRLHIMLVNAVWRCNTIGAMQTL